MFTCPFLEVTPIVKSNLPSVLQNSSSGNESGTRKGSIKIGRSTVWCRSVCVTAEGISSFSVSIMHLLFRMGKEVGRSRSWEGYIYSLFIIKKH